MNSELITFDRDRFTITVRPEGKKELVIQKDDVDISYFSGGAGGQNVNRNLKGIRLIYHIPDEYRMNAMKTQEIVTRVIGKRSLHHNLQAAFEQLAHKLNRYFYVPPHRKKTRIPKQAKEKRLKDKKMKSFKKQSRTSVDF